MNYERDREGRHATLTRQNAVPDVVSSGTAHSVRGPSLGLVGPSIESDRTLPRSFRPALDLIGPSLGF